MTHSTWTWALVGDSSSARIFKFDQRADPWVLVEKIAGDGSSPSEGTGDFGKKSSEHNGALHGHGSDAGNGKATAERRFAHLLAHVLERGLAEKAFGRLIIAAEPKLLGELRENLSRSLQATVVAQVNRDYVHLGAEELRTRLLESVPFNPDVRG